MKTRLALMFTFGLVACGGAGETATSEPCPVPTVDASPPPASDAGPDVEVRDSGAPCALRVDSVAPMTVFFGQAHNTVVTAKGCGFLGVLDVQVSVASVPFKALDDTTLVFLAARDPVTGPASAEVDIIRKQPDQVQTFITYTK